MTLGAFDLSIVTDHIVHALEAARDASHLWDDIDSFEINISGEAPDDARKLNGCRVSLYLFHVSPSPAHRNTFPEGGLARRTPYHPLALTLHYLLSAHDVSDYRHEQQAMSIALKYLHEEPVMTAAVDPTRDERFTITLEPQSVDEIGRLWLAFATPLRLSAVYRAEVLFLTPEELEAPIAGIVLKPEVKAVPLELLAGSSLASPPTDDGIAIVTGAGFDASKIVLRIATLTFAIVAGAPAPGEATVVSDSELHVRLPSGASRGRYLLHVTLLPGAREQVVVLELQVDAS